MNRSVDFSVGGVDASLFGQADQLVYGVDAKFFHDSATMHFHGFLGNTELKSNLFIQHAGDDAMEDLLFTRSEQSNAPADVMHLRAVLSRLPVFFDGFLDCLQEFLMMMRAIIRGRTKNSMGEMPMVFRASISSLTCIVPSWAANAAPVRPAIMIPVMMAPITRTMTII